MANLNEVDCAHCGQPFSQMYTDKQGYTYKLDTTHCSKSCAVQGLRGISKEDLENKAIDFILEKNEYCTKEEICTGVSHSSKTFAKHGISYTDLNGRAGFVKPKSKFQGKVGEILQEEFSNIEPEKQFDGLVGTTGASLRVDFYIPDINTVVEADGSQHSDPKHPWREWNNGTVQDYDRIKNAFFEENGIRLIRIPYKRNLKKQDILSRLN